MHGPIISYIDEQAAHSFARALGRPRPGRLVDARPSSGVLGELGVHVAAAARPRGGGGDQAGDDREGERLVQARAERVGDQVREEAAPGRARRLARGEQVCEDVRRRPAA